MDDDLNCREAVRLMSVALERVLTEVETTLLQRHLNDCLDCRNFEVQVKFIHRAASRFRSGE